MERVEIVVTDASESQNGQAAEDTITPNTDTYTTLENAAILMEKVSLADQGGGDVSIVRSTFEIIGSWKEPKFEGFKSPKGVKNLRRKQAEAARHFYIAIECSIRAARAGYDFAERAEGLCDVLIGQKVYTASELGRYVDRMRNVARDASDEAHDVLHYLRDVRTQFFEIFDEVKLLLQAVLIKLKKYQQRDDNAEKWVKYSEMATKILTGAGGVPAAAKTPVGLPFFPPLLIILPILVPILIISAGITKSVASNIVTKSKTKLDQYQQLFSQLEEDRDTQPRLFRGMKGVVDTWSQLDLELGNILININDLQAEPVAEISLDLLKKRWGTVKESYFNYRQQVMELQDAYKESKSPEVMQKVDEWRDARTPIRGHPIQRVETGRSQVDNKRSSKSKRRDILAGLGGSLRRVASYSA